MKRVAELESEELSDLLAIAKKRVAMLEKVLAKRIVQDESKSERRACTVCCKHVFMYRSDGPRDNGVHDRVCEECGYAD